MTSFAKLHHPLPELYTHSEDILFKVLSSLCMHNRLTEHRYEKGILKLIKLYIRHYSLMENIQFINDYELRKDNLSKLFRN